MTFLMLYGNGWSQRWRIAPGMEEQVRSQIAQVGTSSTGRLPVLDPASDAATTLIVAWAHVAAAVVLEGGVESEGDGGGQYR